MSSHIISLGPLCSVRAQINRYVGQEETQLFDWVRSSFDTVLYILKNIDDESLFSEDKFQCPEIKDGDKVFGMIPANVDKEDLQEPSMKVGGIKCHTVICKPFYFESLHDFPLNKPYMDSMDINIAKFKRRQKRLKDTIITGDVIHFIHVMRYKIITSDKLYEFKQYLYDICPTNKYYLHIAIPPCYKDINKDELTQDRVYLYDFYGDDIRDWKFEGCNWSDIFDNIKCINLTNEI